MTKITNSHKAAKLEITYGFWSPRQIGIVVKRFKRISQHLGGMNVWTQYEEKTQKLMQEESMMETHDDNNIRETQPLQTPISGSLPHPSPPDNYYNRDEQPHHGTQDIYRDRDYVTIIEDMKSPMRQLMLDGLEELDWVEKTLLSNPTLSLSAHIVSLYKGLCGCFSSKRKQIHAEGLPNNNTIPEFELRRRGQEGLPHTSTLSQSLTELTNHQVKAFPKFEKLFNSTHSPLPQSQLRLSFLFVFSLTGLTSELIRLNDDVMFLLSKNDRSHKKIIFPHFGLFRRFFQKKLKVSDMETNPI